MSRARLYAYPRRGQITQVFPATVTPPPTLVPRLTRSSVRAISYTRRRMFSPPFSSATTWTPTNLLRATNRVNLVARRGRIVTPAFQTTPGPGPQALVPSLTRAVIRSARGLLPARRTEVFPLPQATPPAPLPASPGTGGGASRDRLHHWRLK